MENRYNRHNRCKDSLKVHIVLVTKYRKPILNGNIANDIKQKILGDCKMKKKNKISIVTILWQNKIIK